MEPDEPPHGKIEFSGPVARLNRMGADGRVILDTGTIKSRDVPLPLMAQLPQEDGTSPSHGVGVVHRLWVEGAAPAPYLWIAGSFNGGLWSRNVAGALALGLLNPQLDLDRTTFVHITQSDDELGDILSVATDWRVSHITLSHNPGIWDLPRTTVRFPSEGTP